MAEPVYLDYNATTPLAPSVKAKIVESLELWGNPSSSYQLGKTAATAVEKARGQVAEMIGAQASEIVFTSGGTEANHLAILSAIQSYRKETGDVPHVITSNIEHCAILQPLRKYEEDGMCTVTVVPVIKGAGRLTVSSVISAVRDNTCLITIMTANNETGIIQPVKQVFREVLRMNKNRRTPILLHTDAAQAIGKLRVSVDDLKADMLTIVGHKFYGPRIGALYCRSAVKPKLCPMFYGGGQENKIRSGTENTPMIAGLGEASQLVTKNLDVYSAHMKKVRDYLRDGLLRRFDLVLTDEGQELLKGQVLWKYVDIHMLPNTLSVRFGGVDGRSLLQAVSNHLYASTGAACHSGGSVSSVLLNSWVWTEEEASQTVRLSVGRETETADIDRVLDALKAVLSS